MPAQHGDTKAVTYNLRAPWMCPLEVVMLCVFFYIFHPAKSLFWTYQRQNFTYVFNLTIISIFSNPLITQWLLNNFWVTGELSNGKKKSQSWWYPKTRLTSRKHHLFRSLGFQTRGDMREDDLSNSTTDHPACMLQWESIQTKWDIWEIFWLLSEILFHLTSVGNISIS